MPQENTAIGLFGCVGEVETAAVVWPKQLLAETLLGNHRWFFLGNQRVAGEEVVDVLGGLTPMADSVGQQARFYGVADGEDAGGLGQLTTIINGRHAAFA